MSNPQNGYLPPGDHLKTWEQVCTEYGTSKARRTLLADLRVVLLALRKLGVETVWLDGSFSTGKIRPGDIDVIYAPPTNADVWNWGLLSPHNRIKLKARCKIDLWPSTAHGVFVLGTPEQSIKSFMSTDRDGTPRGMLRLDLGGPL
ncbi:hypothetical protein OG788_24835 [Streptomyces sp. NBC_00647]|uniref:DUF6932 family protein n=1 Tax=Streptomyces sp. NBC_00647 TaxID=2975796 RepID=UPI0032474F94